MNKRLFLLTAAFALIIFTAGMSPAPGTGTGGAAPAAGGAILVGPPEALPAQGPPALPPGIEAGGSLQIIDVAVLKESPGPCLWENVEKARLTALVRGGAAFISSGQLAHLLQTPVNTRDRGGQLAVSVKLNGQLISFKEGNKKARVNGKRIGLSENPCRLPGGVPGLWLPLNDWARIAGAEVLRVEGPRPLLLNLSGTSVAGREELDPAWLVSGQARPYGSRDLRRDLKILERLYPGLRIESIGRSALDQDIPVAVLGRGPTEVFISGAWHGDEYITAAFLTRFLEEACRSTGHPGWKPLLERLTLYIAPMINPDGCEVAAHGYDLPPSLADAVAANTPQGFDLSRWRANVQGIDLNNQFPARWEVSRSRLLYNEFPRGSAGHEPLSAPESIAVYQFTLGRGPAAIFCYHSQGEVIFWRSLNGGETPAMKGIADLYGRESGYRPIDTADLSGGYRDWFVTAFGRPGLTIEVGLGQNPLPLRQFDSIWEKNSRALFRSLEYIAYQSQPRGDYCSAK